MPTERKTFMFSARMPRTLVDRVDYVARNIDSDAVTSRSSAIQAAVEAWLPGQEDRLRELGILQKKTR